MTTPVTTTSTAGRTAPAQHAPTTRGPARGAAGRWFALSPC
ncbi:hypothetical protein [Cellulosimicrobium cellulans]|nr:hypothetical protein [Cellulosimicrobium cellulans]